MMQRKNTQFMIMSSIPSYEAIEVEALLVQGICPLYQSSSIEIYKQLHEITSMTHEMDGILAKFYIGVENRSWRSNRVVDPLHRMTKKEPWCGNTLFLDYFIQEWFLIRNQELCILRDLMRELASRALQ
jgi:hypothetical protein